MQSVFSKMKRHRTTAAQGREAEDGPNNAFTGKPLTRQYFNILQTRRNLPVYAQRYVLRGLKIDRADCNAGTSS